MRSSQANVLGTPCGHCGVSHFLADDVQSFVITNARNRMSNQRGAADTIVADEAVI